MLRRSEDRPQGPSSLHRARARPFGAWLLLLILAAVAWPSPAAANPDLKWRTLETEHFYVHYQAGNEEAADRVAMVAERAYTRLSIAWGHDVYLKTHIQLTDRPDVANGRATALPYPQILGSPPSPSRSVCSKPTTTGSTS